MDRRLRAAALIFSVLLVFAGLAEAQIWGRAPNANSGARDRDRDRGYQAGYNAGVQRGRQDAARGVRPNYRNAQYDRGGAGFWGANNSGQYKNGFREGYRGGYDAGYRERGARGGYNNGGYNNGGYNNGNGGYNNGNGGYNNGGYNNGNGGYNNGGYNNGGYNNGGWGVPRNNGPLGQGPNNGAYGTGNIAQVARNNGYREGTIKGQNDARQGKTFDPNRHDAYKDGDQGYQSAYGNKSVYKQDYRAGFMQGYQQGYGNRGTYGGR